MQVQVIRQFLNGLEVVHEGRKLIVGDQRALELEQKMLVILLPEAPPEAPAEPLTELEEERLAELRARTEPLTQEELAELDALAAREGL